MKRKNPPVHTHYSSKFSKTSFCLDELAEQIIQIEKDMIEKDKRIQDLQSRINDMDYTLRQFDLEPCAYCNNYVAEEDVMSCETCGNRGCTTGNTCCKYGKCIKCQKH